MIIKTKLETIVTPALQVSNTSSVAIVLASVSRAITVSLAFLTRLLRGAASPAIVVPAGTPLAWPGLGRDTTCDSDDEGQQETQPDTELNLPEHLSGQFFTIGLNSPLICKKIITHNSFKTEASFSD